MTTEKAINIVRKLLATANDNGASENEAMTAALRAQEIMAKYDINISNIEEQIDEEIVSSSVVIGNGNKWKFMLANIVSTNFCCKVYTVNSSTIVFHGYKRHADVAKSVFEFLFETGVKLAKKYVRKCKKEGIPNKGIYNNFLAECCSGIKTVLEKQCTTLALVVPKEVVKSFEELTFGCRSRKQTLKIHKQAEAYNEGIYAGKKNTIRSRELEVTE